MSDASKGFRPGPDDHLAVPDDPDETFIDRRGREVSCWWKLDYTDDDGKRRTVFGDVRKGLSREFAVEHFRQEFDRINAYNDETVAIAEYWNKHVRKPDESRLPVERYRQPKLRVE
jgi:hypothetical protein